MKKLFTLGLAICIIASAFCTALRADVFQNFDGGGTAYLTSYNQNTPNNTFGVQENGMFRLLTGEGNLRNNIYFNNNDIATNYITATFDVKMSGAADGISFSLVNTNTHTDLSGLFSGQAAESSGLSDSLTLGFAIYNQNNTRLYWNGTQQGSDLDNGVIKSGNTFSANVSVNFAQDNSGAYVYVSLVNSANGDVYTIPNQFISGLTPYNSSVLFAGRTGGSVATSDLDNISVVYNSDAPIAQRWIPDKEGNLYDAANWENNTVPANGTAQIYGGTNKITRHVQNGVNLLVTGGSTTAGQEFHIGSDADSVGNITMENGEFLVTGKTIIGSAIGSTGTLTVNGGHFRTTPAELVVIGDSGTGTVIVNGGVYEVVQPAEQTTVVGYQPSGKGSIIVNGGVAKFGNDLLLGRTGTAIMELTGGQTIVGRDFQGNNESGSTASLSLSGDAKMTVNGTFKPAFKENGQVKFDFNITDDAELYVGGNFWGGNNNAGSNPLDGETYAINFTFGGNSKTSVAEFWVAMSAKSHILIEDNATITSRSGNSGIGWNNKSVGSVLEMTGGTFTAPTFNAGNAVRADMFLSGGTANFTTFNVGTEPNAAGSLTEISGGTLNATNVNINHGKIELEGGILNATNLNKAGTGAFEFTGGTLNATNINFDLTQAGGFLSPGGDRELGTTIFNNNFTSTGGAVVLDIFENSQDSIIINDGYTWTIADDILLYINGYDGIETGDIFNFAIGDILGAEHILSASPYWLLSYDAGTGVLSAENVPEPATWLLLGLGVLAMGVCRVRRA